MTAKEPTGRLDGRTITMTRMFDVPQSIVWQAVTSPEKLHSWIGTCTGDPATGSVEFRLTADCEDAPVDTIKIVRCEEPAHLELRWPVDNEVWHIAAELTESAGTTTLGFRQTFDSGASAANAAPMWECLLDRLVALLAGEDLGEANWTPYQESLGQHYRQLGDSIDAEHSLA